jgi:hypothetical protein
VTPACEILTRLQRIRPGHTPTAASCSRMGCP